MQHTYDERTKLARSPLRSIAHQVSIAIGPFYITITLPNLHFTPTRRSLPYRFSGKERLDRAGLPLYDFGARWYNPATPAWLSQDPLSEKYYPISPYAYCAGNPVNLVDPSGMWISEGSLAQWSHLLLELERRIKELEEEQRRIYSRAQIKGWDEKTLQRKLGENPYLLATLNDARSTMSLLENSTQGYEFVKTPSNSVGSIKYIPETGIIQLSYDSSPVFFHELTHARQFEFGDIGFYKDGSGSIANDYWDEIRAYQTQYAYDPSSVGVSSIFHLTVPWLTSVTDPTSGNYLYRNQNGQHIGIIPINKNTPFLFLNYAYPGAKPIHTEKRFKDYEMFYFK